MNFILLSHIVIALSSLVFTAYVCVSPSARKLQASYGLAGATLATGTFVAISTHASLTQACTTGLVYLATMLAGVAISRYRLAHQAS